MPVSRSVVLLEGWSEEPLPLEAVAAGPIGQKVESLISRLGGSFESALLLASMSMAAAIGPARYILSPLGYRLPATMNLILVGNPSTVLSGAVMGEFANFRAMIQREIRRASLEDSRRRAEDLTQTRIELLRAEDLLTGRQVPKIEPGPLGKRDPEIRAMLEAHERPYILAQTRELKQRLEKTLLDLTLASHPDLIADGLMVEELSDPGSISFDAAALNLSLAGQTLRSIRRASPQELAKLGRLLSSSWSGTAPFSASVPRSYRPLVSNVWLANREEAAAFLSCQTFADCEVSPSLAALEVPAGALLNSSPDVDPEGWLACLNFYLTKRFAGEYEMHWLEDEAVVFFKKFVEEIDTLLPDLPPRARPYALHWADMAVKIALLLHVGSFDAGPPDPGKSPQLDTETGAAEHALAPSQTIKEPLLRLAVAIVKRIGATQLRLIAAPDKLDQRAGEPDKAVEKMQAKLQLHGPLTQHELFRKYSKQRTDILEPVLLRGLASHRIAQEGKTFYAVDDAVSENHQQQR